MTTASDNGININQQLKRTAKDSLIYLPAMVLPAITGIVLIRVLTTIFTPEEYGYYQITFSTFGLIRVFSMTWLSVSVIRFYLTHKNNNQNGIFFSTLFISTIVGAIAIAGLGFLINILVFREKINSILFNLINIAIIASISNSFFEIFIMVYRAGLESKKYSLFWILFSVGKPVIGVGLILAFDFRVNGIFWSFFIVPLVLDLILIYKLELIKFVRLSLISGPLFRYFVKYGIPITFSSLSFWILSLSDRYLIEFFRGTSEVGLYSVGYTISEKTLNFIYTIIMLAAFPIIVDNWEKYGNESTQELITRLTRYFFFLCVPVLIILVVIPEQVLFIFSSHKFEQGATVLPLIAMGIFILGLTQYVLKGFELHKKSHKIAFLALTAGITNIILNTIMIPRFGFLGAGISACSAYIVYLALSIYFVKADMAWHPPYRSILNCMIAGVVLAFYLKQGTFLFSNIFCIAFLIIPVGVVLFFAVLFLLKEIKREEIHKGLNFVFNLLKN